MSIYELPDEERKAYFRENKRLSRLKFKGIITKEEMKRRNKEQYEKNKQRYKDKASRWNKKHAEYMQAISCTNRVKSIYPDTFASSSITVEELEYWIEELKGTACPYCGNPTASIDHIVPLCAGGIHEFTNMQMICKSCNSLKGSKTEEELYTRISQMFEGMECLRNSGKNKWSKQ